MMLYYFCLSPDGTFPTLTLTTFRYLVRINLQTDPSKYWIGKGDIDQQEDLVVCTKKCSDYTSSPQGQRSSDESIPTCNDDVHCSLSKGAL